MGYGCLLSHVPSMPQQLVAAKIGLFLQRNNFDAALQVRVSERAYLRPSEARGLRPQDVVLPCAANASLSHVSLLLGSSERATPTKTQTYDDAVCSGSALVAWKFGPASCTKRATLVLPL